MVEVQMDRATDRTLRETRPVARFQVLKACKEPFSEELVMMYNMEVLLHEWAPTKPKTFLQRLNIIRTFYRYCRRFSAALRIMRQTHAIYERTKGFQWAHDHAIRSAILFGAPRFMQGFMARRFLLRAKRRQAKEDSAAFEREIDIAEAEAQA